MCQFGQNPSIHSGDRVQTRGYTGVDADMDPDSERILNKNSTSPHPMVVGGGGERDIR